MATGVRCVKTVRHVEARQARELECCAWWFLPPVEGVRSALGIHHIWDEQTQAGWHLDELEAELRELRERSVEIQAYDMPGLKTVDGIADIGFARAAWIVDPHGNALGIMQRKQRPRACERMHAARFELMDTRPAVAPPADC